MSSTPPEDVSEYHRILWLTRYEQQLPPPPPPPQAQVPNQFNHLHHHLHQHQHHHHHQPPPLPPPQAPVPNHFYPLNHHHHQPPPPPTTTQVNNLHLDDDDHAEEWAVLFELEREAEAADFLNSNAEPRMNIEDVHNVDDFETWYYGQVHYPEDYVSDGYNGYSSDNSFHG